MSSPATQVSVDPAVQTALKNQHVYLLFAKEVGPLVKAKYPTIQKVQFNQILGRIWNEMPTSERDKYHQKAEYQQNQQKLVADFQTNIKQEKNTSDQVSSEPSPIPAQQQPATNIYSMDTLNPNNENVKRIFLQRVDNQVPSAVSQSSPHSIPYGGLSSNSSVQMQGPYQAQPPMMGFEKELCFAPSPQQAMNEKKVQGSKLYKPILPKEAHSPQDIMKQYPMFPMYFKNMYTTLKKIYSDKSDEELKLKAFAMFQEMLLTDRQYYNATTAHKTIPEPVQHVPDAALNMPLILSSEVPVVKSVTPPPMQSNPANKKIRPSPRPFTSAEKLGKGASAYNIFTREMHPIVYAQYSNLKTAEVSKLLGKMWSKMTEVEKSKYCQMAKNETSQLAEMRKSRDKEITENMVFREEEIPVLQKEHAPVEEDPLEQIDAIEPEPTLEETTVRNINETIADEYQITIKQEPIYENEEPITESVNNELGDETSLDVSAVIENSPKPSSEVICRASLEIKTERIEIESVESIDPQEGNTASSDPVESPSVNEDTSIDANIEGSTGESNTLSSVENTVEPKAPKTQVVFHNLDFFIKTEPNEIQSEETDNEKVNPQVDQNEPSIMTEPSINNEKPGTEEPMETPESGTTRLASKNEEVEKETSVQSKNIEEQFSSVKSPLPIFSHDDLPASTNKVEKSDTKDELKSLIGALVSKRTPDGEVIRKIVNKTRANLTETEAPTVSYRKTGRMDMEKSVESSNPNQILYCYCRSPISKNLIGCDFCPEWFHPKCLGLSKYELKMVLSLSNWKCPECIKNTDGDKVKKMVKAQTSSPKMHQSAKARTLAVSPKNKTSPVTHTASPVKARRLSTNEKIIIVHPDALAKKESPRSVEKVDTPEVVANIVKQDSKQKCDTCHILVEEVKRRGETIERMARKIEMLEKNSSVHNSYKL